MSYTSIPSPVGTLTIFAGGDAIVAVEWGRAPETPGGGEGTPLLREAATQLREYFAKSREAFDLPLLPSGTEHERAVWKAMTEIPFGHQRTYGDIADELGSVARAVGGACGRNPIPIIIPCHRVVGANGRLTGFSGGEGVETKQWLLRHEGLLLA